MTQNEEYEAMNQRIEKAVIKRAENVDIVSLCQAVGIDLIQESRTQYRGVEHGSLVIFQESNSFYWYKAQEGGNCIDFVRRFLNKDFRETVEFLNEYADKGLANLNEGPNLEAQKREPFKYFYTHDSTTEAIENYLVKERGLNASLIKTLINKGFIKQSTYKNETRCLFVWGKNGRRVGVTLQGIAQDKEKYGFRGTSKKVGKNSEKDYGFNVSLGKPKDLYFFESPIDCLSYWSLHPELDHCRLVSMTGLNKNTVMNLLKDTILSKSTRVENVYLGVDNDRAGQKFIDQFQDMGYEFEAGGALQFLPLIPENNVIPSKNLTVYKEIGKQFKVPWELLAAWHKTESNFSETHASANGMKVHSYFSKKPNSPGEKERIKLEEVTTQLAKDLNRVKNGGKFDCGKLIESDKKNNVPGFLKKMRSFYKEYHTGNFQMKEEFLKDWNDVLKMQKQQNQVKEKIYMNDKKQELTVEVRDSNQEAESGKKYVASIWDRKKVMGHFEADSKEEMEKLIKVYGFQAVDKEDVRKYEPKLFQKEERDKVLN